MKLIIYIVIVLCTKVTFGQSDTMNTITLNKGCEALPQFPGGSLALNKFIKENQILPDPKAYNITGTCYVSFVIDTMGKIKDIKVVKGIKGCFECDEEAKRLISIMPNWIPSKLNGKTIECKMNYPVKFKMI